MATEVLPAAKDVFPKRKSVMRGAESHAILAEKARKHKGFNLKSSRQACWPEGAEASFVGRLDCPFKLPKPPSTRTDDGKQGSDIRQSARTQATTGCCRNSPSD
jgi:hypothetical protein